MSTPKKKIHDPVIDKMYKDLVESEKAQNRILLTEFIQRYGPLYNTTTDVQKHTSRLKALANEMQQRFCLYRPIELLGDDGKVLITLPSVLVEVQSSNQDSIGEMLVSLHKQTLPKYAADNVRNLIKVFRKLNAGDYKNYETFKSHLVSEFKTECETTALQRSELLVNIGELKVKEVSPDKKETNTTTNNDDFNEFSAFDF